MPRMRRIVSKAPRMALLLASALVLLAGGLVSGRGAAAPGTELLHTGLCDASAGVALDEGYFAVADDENNTLCNYRNDRSGPASTVSNVSLFLEVKESKPESDMEGAAWLGDRIYWIASHGRNKDGKFRESRHRFFATKLWRT